MRLFNRTQMNLFISESNSKPHNKTSHNPIVANLIFCADVIFVCFLVLLTLYLDVIYFHNPLGETSLTEISEQLLLLSISIRFFIHSRSELNRQGSKTCNHSFILAGAFFLVLLMRELDHWFDFISHGAWVYPALTVAFLGIYNFFKHKSVSFYQLNELLRHRYAPVLTLGVIFLLVLSRIAGMSAFWHEVMGEDYVRQVKNIVEEGSELLAYYIIAVGAFKVTKSEQV
ncbi:hypothetical protein [Vibrio sp. HN007]|uniref:hypothetical protein n=1 Tax=Vibrio iocasae TaxID=3098914 RepID=UPI0035D49F91